MGQKKSNTFDFLHTPNNLNITSNNWMLKIKHLLLFLADNNGILLSEFPDENNKLSQYCFELYNYITNNQDIQLTTDTEYNTCCCDNNPLSWDSLIIPEIEANRPDYEALVPSKVLRHMEKRFL